MERAKTSLMMFAWAGMAIVGGAVALFVTYLWSVFWYWIGLWPLGALMRVVMWFEFAALVITVGIMVLIAIANLFRPLNETTA